MNNQVSVAIVEDNLFYAELIKEYLQHEGNYDIAIYESGESLLSEKQLPEVLITDYNLNAENEKARMNGDELMKKLKDMNASVPVIAISAQKSVEMAVDFIKLGVYDYVVKNENAFESLSAIVKKAAGNVLTSSEIKQLEARHKKDSMKKYFLIAVLISVFLGSLLFAIF